MVIAGATEALHRIRTRMSDATARVSGEDRRSMLYEHLRFAISADAIGAWDLDVTADFIEASPEMRATYGFSRDARLDSQAFFSTVAADDLPRTQAALKAARETANTTPIIASIATVMAKSGGSPPRRRLSLRKGRRFT